MSRKLLNKFFILTLASLVFVKIDATNIIRFRNLNTTQKKEVIDNTCSICCEDFKDLASQPNNNVEIIKLNCNHYFCKNCINQFLVNLRIPHDIYGRYQKNCPNCRANIDNIDDFQEIHVNSQEYLNISANNNSNFNNNLEEEDRNIRNLRNNNAQNNERNINDIKNINDRLGNIKPNLILFNKTNSGMLGFLYAKLVNPNTIKSKKSRTILWSLPIFLMFIDNTKASHNNSSFISNLVSFSIGSWLGLNTNNNKDNNNNK